MGVVIHREKSEHLFYLPFLPRSTPRSPYLPSERSVPYYFQLAVPRFVLRAQHRPPLISARALRAELLSGQCCLRRLTRVAPLGAEFLSECDDSNYLHLGERRKRSPRWYDERTPVRAAVAGVGAIRPGGCTMVYPYVPVGAFCPIQSDRGIMLTLMLI